MKPTFSSSSEKFKFISSDFEWEYKWRSFLGSNRQTKSRRVGVEVEGKCQRTERWRGGVDWRLLGQGRGAVLKSARLPVEFCLPRPQKYYIPSYIFPFCFHLVFLYIFKVLFSPSLPQISLSLGISTYLTPLFQEKVLHAKHMLFRGCSLVGDCPFFQILYSLIMGICLKSTVIEELAFISTQINISQFFHLCVYRKILNSLTFRSLQFWKRLSFNDLSHASNYI